MRSQPASYSCRWYDARHRSDSISLWIADYLASRPIPPHNITGKPGRVAFYSCGPTVYDFAHIGNFRAFLTYDILKRWLMYVGRHTYIHTYGFVIVRDRVIIVVGMDHPRR